MGPPYSIPHSIYISLSHSCSKLKRHVDEYPSPFTIYIYIYISLFSHRLNLNAYFCLDGKNDFFKTNNITSIHKIPDEQIHNLYAIDILFWKKKKYHENFERPQWSLKENVGKRKNWMCTKVRSFNFQIQKFNSYRKKKMKGFETWDLRQIHTWNNN